MVVWHVRKMSCASAALHRPITRRATAAPTVGNKQRLQHDRPHQQYNSFFHTSESWCGSNSGSNNNDRHVISFHAANTASASFFSKGGGGGVTGRRFQERASMIPPGGRHGWILRTVATTTNNEKNNKSRRRYYHRPAVRPPLTLTPTPIAAAAAAAVPYPAAVQVPAAMPTPPTPPLPPLSITTQSITTPPPERFFGPVYSTVAQKTAPDQNHQICQSEAIDQDSGIVSTKQQ
jgi:hypothetical protein